MRKYNSSFKTAFISEAGNRLENNDYFGFVELDNYACYVIADGITDMRNSESARVAIEAVVNAFQSDPGMSRRKVRSYLRNANNELLKGQSYEKLKASVTVVVTDYQKCRYGYAGNTRFRLYRDGKDIFSSFDMSLSQDMVKEEKLSGDKLAEHEERNNLYCYFGRRTFNPYISRKIKLQNGDIIALYTRGIWENVDEGEITDVFSECGNEPSEECDKVEDLLLSRQPENLDNYTFAAIYADKVFIDPNRKKRIKKIVTIAIVIAILLLIIGLVIFLWRRDRRQKREDMEQYFLNVETYMEDNNFIRAKEECEKALEAAGKLHDKEAEDKYNSYLVSLEAVIRADDSYENGDFTEAKDAYLSAKARVRYADNAGLSYIDKRLAQIKEYEQVFDSIALGDSLLDLESYALAEEKYIEAKDKAASIYFADGKQQALDALDALYEKWSAAREEEEAKNAELAASQVSAAEIVKQGDETAGEGDYDGAMVYYLIALEKYGELEDTAQIAFLNKKISTLNEKKAEVEARMEEAKMIEEQARLYDEENKYELAKAQYQYAKAIYTELGKDNKANEIQGKIDILDSKTAQQEKEQAQEEKEQAEQEKKEKEEKEAQEKKKQEEKEAQEKKEQEEKEAQEKKEKEEQERKEKEEQERKEKEEREKKEEELKKKEEELNKKEEELKKKEEELKKNDPKEEEQAPSGDQNQESGTGEDQAQAGT